MKYQAIVLAAGSGIRANLPYNKIFYEIGNMPIVLKAANNFINDDDCTKIIITYKEEDKTKIENIFKDVDKVCLIKGGNTRQESTANALALINEDYVLIHDGARPFFSNDLLKRIKDKLNEVDAVIPGINITDTVKKVIAGKVVDTLNRNELYTIQTPQGFKTNLIKKAHNKIKENIEYTDDGMLIEKLTNSKVYVVEGEKENIKFTRHEDFKE